MSWRGFAKRVMSPSSAITVAAATKAIPRSACRARTTRNSDQSRQRHLDMSFQTVASRRRRLDRGDAVFQHDVMRRLLESQSGHPATVHQCPRRPIVVTAMAQEKARELLTGLAQTADGRKDARVRDRGSPHEPDQESTQRSDSPGAMRKLGQVDRIPPVGLDPISRLAWDQRRSNDNTTMPSQGQLPLNAIAARAGLITEP